MARATPVRMRLTHSPPEEQRSLNSAILALEDGTVFEGRSFGAPTERSGEVVFNTALTGYQEVFTDPSYSGQIVILTNPQIGNYGTSREDNEAAHPHIEGLVVREFSAIASNWRSDAEANTFLARHGIPVVSDLDTRALVRHLRTRGVMRGVLSSVERDAERLVERARSIPTMTGLDLASRVSTTQRYEWTQGVEACSPSERLARPLEPRYHVVAYDYGIKRNILRRLVQVGCRVTVVPATTSTDDIVALKPNHPVRNEISRKIEITSHNHGFAVDPDSLDLRQVEITHMNLNDGTLEGFRHRNEPFFCVQYHPEAAPGPHDSHYLFDDFVQLMSGKP